MKGFLGHGTGSGDDGMSIQYHKTSIWDHATNTLEEVGSMHELKQLAGF